MQVSHPLQSQAWGTFRRVMGIDVVRLNEWQLTFHKIPFTPFTIGYFPKGPMPTREMLETLATLGKEKNAIFIQLEPNSIGHWTLDIGHYGLRPSHHPLFPKYTFVLDLTKSEEELLNAMHPKTRYNINVAQKHGVVIAEDNSSATFDQYIQLVKETTHRQGFYAHNETYHRRMWETLRQSSRQALPIAHLWTATYKENVLAAWIIFVWNNTIYYPYGASSREHREVMAPTLLLWEIARWGKRQGFQAFDLWGALGPKPDQNDPWYGFHRFKQGFSPKLIEFIGSYDLVINPLLYRIYKVADIIRWKILR